MVPASRFGVACGLAVVAGAGCARAARPARPDAGARPAAAARVAALDSASARRLCAAPDSVLAGRAPCVLRNQAPPVRVFWAGAVYSGATFAERWAAAGELADRTIRVRGFVEWDSGFEPVPAHPG